MAMYVPVGNGRYRSTEHTQGPWDVTQQHMGPVTALLVHEIERIPGLPVAKLNVDVLGPVPVAEVEVSAEIVKDGKRVQCVAASLTSGGRELVRATAWRIRQDETPATPSAAPPAAVPPLSPRDAESFLATGFGYGRAMDWRFIAGAPDDLGPATAWGRIKVPLVEGEEITPLERLAIYADSGNGISRTLDITRYLFANVDLTISLLRAPVGEWICMAAATTIGPSGRGLTRTTLFDEAGEVGASAQTLFVGAR